MFRPKLWTENEKIKYQGKLTEVVSRGRKLLAQETGKFFKQKVGQTNIALTTVSVQ